MVKPMRDGNHGKTRHVLIPQATTDELQTFRDGAAEHHPGFISIQSSPRAARRSSVLEATE
jgi:hypothetical protein